MIDNIKAQTEESSTVDILQWTAKFALDVLGLGAILARIQCTRFLMLVARSRLSTQFRGD